MIILMIIAICFLIFLVEMIMLSDSEFEKEVFTKTLLYFGVAIVFLYLLGIL